jgi:uroporphyrin-3 C-methyltransferase
MTDQAEAKQPLQPSPEKTQSHSVSSNKTFLLILLTCSIAILLGIFYLNDAFDELKLQDQQLHKNIAALEFKIAQGTSSIDELKTAFSHQLQQDQQAQKQLQQTVQQITLKMSESTESWRLQDAQELIRLAKLQLSITQNIPTALELLKTADEQIKDLNDPRFQFAREALAKDILNLETLANVDIAGTLAQINVIRQELPSLPWPLEFNNQPAEQAPAVTTEATESTAPQKKSWRDNFWASLAYIKQFLVIRHNNTVTDKMLDTAGKNNVVLLIDLSLLKADFGLLKRDNALYQQSIHQAYTLIERYFNSKEARTKAVLEQLATLEKFSIQTEMPNLDNSYNAVQKAIVLFKENQTVPPKE